MKLTFKPEHANKVVSKRFTGIGTVEVDTSKSYSQQQLKRLYDGGFSELFYYAEETKEVVETSPIETAKRQVEDYKGITAGVVLTEADALADLNGTPRPDNKLEMTVEDITPKKITKRKKK